MFEKEMEQVQRIIATKEDELLQCHMLEKKRLPKILKSDTKTRQMMFRASLRISSYNSSPLDEKVKVKQVGNLRTSYDRIECEFFRRVQCDRLGCSFESNRSGRQSKHRARKIMNDFLSFHPQSLVFQQTYELDVFQQFLFLFSKHSFCKYMCSVNSEGTQVICARLYEHY